MLHELKKHNEELEAQLNYLSEGIIISLDTWFYDTDSTSDMSQIYNLPLPITKQFSKGIKWGP